MTSTWNLRRVALLCLFLDAFRLRLAGGRSSFVLILGDLIPERTCGEKGAPRYEVSGTGVGQRREFATPGRMEISEMNGDEEGGGDGLRNGWDGLGWTPQRKVRRRFSSQK